jgi:hypothetical protein
MQMCGGWRPGVLHGLIVISLVLYPLPSTLAPALPSNQVGEVLHWMLIRALMLPRVHGLTPRTACTQLVAPCNAAE